MKQTLECATPSLQRGLRERVLAQAVAVVLVGGVLGIVRGTEVALAACTNTLPPVLSLAWTKAFFMCANLLKDR